MSPNLIIVFGCLAMFLLALGIVLFVLAYQKKVLSTKNQLQLAENTYQAQLLKATILTEQAEREKIAKNLHDDLGTSLNILRLNIEKLNRNSENLEIVKSTGTNSLDMINKAMQDLRSISRDLMPATLMKLGLVQSLGELCKHIHDAGLCAIDYKAQEVESKMANQTEVQLYRICQEVMNNLLKHAKPTAIFIELYFDNGFFIIFKHNGVGISDEEIRKIYTLNKGVGLKSIESRIRMINGRINYIQKTEHESIIEIAAK